MRPFDSNRPLASTFVSFSGLGHSTTAPGAQDPRGQSRFSHAQPLQNKLTSFKSAKSSNFQTEKSQNKIVKLPTEEVNPLTQDLVSQDGFQLVSQFETEADALKYATELQKYYNDLNMDVKVQVELNLENIDDTVNKTHLMAAMSESKAKRLGEGEATHGMSKDAHKTAQQHLKAAFESHFQKNEQCLMKQGKRIIKRGDDLTKPEFQKRVNKQLTKENVEFKHLSKEDIREIMETQEQIYGVIRD